MTEMPPATVQVCPPGLEILAPATEIDRLFSIAIRNGNIAIRKTVEPGDVGRFSVFLKEKYEENDQSQSLVNNVINAGGRVQSLLERPPAVSCRYSLKRERMAKSDAKTWIYEVDQDQVSKLTEVADRAIIKYDIFSNVAGKTILKFDVPEGVNGYKFQTITYRFLRGDYGPYAEGFLVPGFKHKITEIVY